MSDEVTPEAIKPGQKWKSARSARVYLVVSVMDQGATLKRVDDGRVGTYAFDVMRTVGMTLFEDAPLPHDFSDRYSSGKDNDGKLILFCQACGVGQGVNDGKPCVPDHMWRALVEDYIATLTWDADCKRDEPALFPFYLKAGGFRQCNPSLIGGVFSLRDEDHERRRR